MTTNTEQTKATSTTRKSKKAHKYQFLELYPNQQDQELFLATFDLVNLTKASKMHKLRIGKNPTKASLIDAIIKHDLKKNYLICKQLYNNGPSYMSSVTSEGIKLRIADLQRQ